MKENKTRRLVLSLIVVIVLLLGLVLYMFLIKPMITGNAVNLRNEGLQYAVVSIMQQASQCQPVPLTSGETTINLIAMECLPPACLQAPPQ